MTVTPPGADPAYGAAPQPTGGLIQADPGGAPISTGGRRFAAFLLEILLSIVTLGIGWLIWSLIVWGDGKTPAKALMGMRVVNSETGQVATWGTMALREVVGKWILGNVTFGITTVVGGIMILGESRQAIWDKIATTVVVDEVDR
jgi:uncharacterized RDD family membrane protein YckC